MKKKVNHSHITLEGRKYIEEKLNESASISEIAYDLKRNKSSILRGVQRHIIFVFPSIFNNYHPCMKSNNCPVKDLNCFETCKNIEINLCPS